MPLVLLTLIVPLVVSSIVTVAVSTTGVTSLKATVTLFSPLTKLNFFVVVISLLCFNQSSSYPLSGVTVTIISSPTLPLVLLALIVPWSAWTKVTSAVSTGSTIKLKVTATVFSPFIGVSSLVVDSTLDPLIFIVPTS